MGALGDMSARDDAARRACGIALLVAWSDVTLFSKLVHYSTRNSIAHLNSTYAFFCLGMGLALLAVSLPRTRAALRPGGARRAPAVCAALLAACTAVLVMVEHRLFTQPWCSITSTVAGGAFALLLLAWASRLAREPRRRMPWVLAAGLVAGAAASVGVLYLPKAVAIAVTALLPLVSAAVLRRDLARDPGEPARSALAGDGRWWRLGSCDRAPLDARVRRCRVTMLRALGSVALVSFAESLERALFMSLSPGSETFANHWVLLGSCALGAVTLAAVADASSRTGRHGLLNGACTSVLAFLFLLAPIVRGVWLLGDLATLTCHFLLIAFAIVVFVRAASEYCVSLGVTFAPGMGAFALASLAGTLLGSSLVSFATLGYRASSLLALLSATLAMLSLLFVLDEHTLVELTNADEQRPAAPRRFALRVDAVARAYGLSEREAQVLGLLARGRTMQRVQEELGISAGTANTHLTHVYRKLGVHDRQGMLDLVEGGAPTTSRRAPSPGAARGASAAAAARCQSRPRG